jgi:hypothetical protein
VGQITNCGADHKLWGRSQIVGQIINCGADHKLWGRSQIVGQITNCGADHKLLVAEILFPCMYTTKDKHEEKKDNTTTMVDKKMKYNIGIE